MNDLVAAIGMGGVVFVSTNVDDILLLATFFADPALSRGQVVAGQFIGMGALVAISAVCGLLAVAVPPGYVALLGVAPLLLGLHGVWRLWRARQGADTERREEGERRGGAGVVAVAAVTLANGGDNLGVYIPLFSSSPQLVPLHVAVFAVLTGVWCVAGYYLVDNPLFGERLGRHGRLALPFVLIALGLWILADARSLLA
jgi:cadmium resistance protein CadD (predicted permease)